MKQCWPLFAVLLAACGGQSADLAPPVETTTPRVRAVPDAGTPLIGEAYNYAYNPVGKRDPFRSLVDEPKTGENGKEGNSSLCGDPLCQFDLDQLVLVAVVSGDANPLAMLEDPTHTGHFVRRNTKIGKQGGKVTQILRDCVVVTEYFQTPDGKVNPNRVNLCVKQDRVGADVLDLLTNKTYQSQ